MNERELFLSALEFPTPEEQRNYVDTQCAEDTELKEAVMSLLNIQPEASDFLEKPLFPVDESSIEQSESAHSTVTIMDGNMKTHDTDSATEYLVTPQERFSAYLEPTDSGDTLGKLPGYEVLEVLGEGGMGVVFRVDDVKLKRVVALKMLAPEFAANATARKRFLREAQTAASINHPHVVTIHAVNEGKLPYLVMECVDGQSLQEKLVEQGTLTELEVLRIGSQIAQGLAAAHAQGLIHRDVKPANILLENGVERVKLTDFGLARAIDDVSITQTGQIAGTPLYMSPEQTKGSGIDHRCDLFSLGCVLYAMCTGRSPFRAANTVAIIQRINQDTPRPIQEINPEISQSLVDVINRLLEKDLADRFQSASEVADLFTVLLHQRMHPAKLTTAVPSVTKDDSLDTTEPAPQSKPRRRFWWVGTCLLVIALLGAAEATGRTNFGGSVMRIVLGESTLVVEVDDPAISVTLNGEDLVLTGAGPKEIRITPGEYKLEATKDGKPLHQEVFTLTRDGKKQASISWQPTQTGNAKEPRLPSKEPVTTAKIDLNKIPAPPVDVPLIDPMPRRKIDQNHNVIAGEFPFTRTQAKQYQLQCTEEFQIPARLTNSIGMEFRLIPSGSFSMGIDERFNGRPQPSEVFSVGVGLRRIILNKIAKSRPVRDVTLTQPYYIGAHEVTQEQFVAVMGQNPSRYKPDNDSLEDPPTIPTGDHPVESVPWLQAIRFCNRLSEKEGLKPCYEIKGNMVSWLDDGTGYRLPTSAEWEFASRAGWIGRYYTTDTDDLTKFAWTRASFKDEETTIAPQPVGKLIPNAFGLYDTLGNVAEWTWDTFQPYEQERNILIDPATESTVQGVGNHVVRGQSANSAPLGIQIGLHNPVSFNQKEKKTNLDFVGFRVVKTHPIALEETKN